LSLRISLKHNTTQDLTGTTTWRTEDIIGVKVGEGRWRSGGGQNLRYCFAISQKHDETAPYRKAKCDVEVGVEVVEVVEVKIIFPKSGRSPDTKMGTMSETSTSTLHPQTVEIRVFSRVFTLISPDFHVKFTLPHGRF
jgi:hypothetical protein